MNPILLNIFGLSLDLIGAALISVEFFLRFKSEKYVNNEIGCGDTLAPIPTKEFVKSEKARLQIMGIGLSLLFAGFLVQISANYIQLHKSNIINVNNGTGIEKANRKNQITVSMPNMELAPMKSENMNTPLKNKISGK